MNVTGKEQLDDWIIVDYFDKDRKPLPANAAFAVSPKPDGSPGMLTYGGDGANGVRDFGTVLFYNADMKSWYTLRSKPQSRYTWVVHWHSLTTILIQQAFKSIELPAVLDNNQTVWIWGGKS